MQVPDVLYHATLKENGESIWENGIYVGKQGLTYFADSINGAAAFLAIHSINLEDILVFEIDTSNLAIDLIDYGADHNPRFFKDIEVYTYPEHISPACINNVYELFYQTEET